MKGVRERGSKKNYLTPQVSQKPILVVAALRAHGGAREAGEGGNNLGHDGGVGVGGHVLRRQDVMVLADGDVGAGLDAGVRALRVEDGRSALLAGVLLLLLDEAERAGAGGGGGEDGSYRRAVAGGTAAARGGGVWRSGLAAVAEGGRVEGELLGDDGGEARFEGRRGLSAVEDERVWRESARS